ncbi:hypothetical protein [Ralstonia phage RP12]|uniref:Uncharacterized protein n=1 Tax=Ralstonia phage RP12 TaxID=1923889 RepID=A0A1L7N128_9CAUD|nr:hypothetical protein FDH28_gp020 [Ralstonia phage RP12]BAW18994.1 hypothetical protein [Ralstonia phage RP12]
MLTATTIPSTFHLNQFPRAQFSTRVNPETSFVMYSRYRDMALGLIDTNSPEIFYRVFNNAPDSFNGEGMHEKFIYRGQSVLDISVGLLDFPWFAADSNPINEITGLQLQQMANSEQIPLVAWRLRQIANFAGTLPPYTRYYHYMGVDGTRAITMEDEFNSVKFSCILTFAEE